MADNLATDEDYIDMELNSMAANSSPHSKEFEFQMSASCCENEAVVFPADELFYKGKLLPLHLPPRLQMVQKLGPHTAGEDEFYYTMPFLPAVCSTAPCTNSNTPLDSCNISPSESCRVSCELSPDDYFFEWSAELSSFVNGDHRSRKKSWSKKFKLIKRYSVLGQKLKASRTYLKSLFTKSACSDDQSSTKEADNSSKVVDDTSNQYMKIPKKKSIGVQNIARASYPTIANIIKNLDKEVGNEDHAHRKSFSGAIKQPAKCLSLSSSNSSSTAGSSSSSLNSNGFHELQLLGRSSSVTEVECSIQSAIEYCKRSQKAKDSRNLSRDSGLSSLSASRICSV